MRPHLHPPLHHHRRLPPAQQRKELAGGAVAVALYNAGTKGVVLALDFADVGFATDTAVEVFDVFAESPSGTHTGTFTPPTAVPAHGTLLYTLRGVF